MKLIQELLVRRKRVKVSKTTFLIRGIMSLQKKTFEQDSKEE